MPDKETQLAILADALTKIVQVATVNPVITTPAGELRERAGDLAAQALVAAATYGPLPAPAVVSNEASQEMSGNGT